MNFLIFISTIDWFDYSGYLRELGARPLNLIFLILPLILLRRRKLVNKYVLFIFVLLFLPVLASFLGFLINYNNITDYSIHKEKIEQFLYQLVMYLVFLINIITIYLYCNNAHLINILKYFKICFLLNLIFIFIEYFKISVDFINLFRVYQIIDRPSGLHTEPSYASFALIFFSLPLFLFGKRFDKIFLVIALLYIWMFNAKTGLFVLLISISLYFILVKRNYLYFLLSLLTTPIFLFLFGFDFSDNLSLVMRIGSTHLSLNVAAEYFHTLFGIGFGQFNFLYLKEFSPDYLLLSFEAKEYMSGVNSSRAPTFNFFSRLFLEVGLFGFISFFLALYLIVKRLIIYNNELSKVLLLCLFMSFSFLLTQDGYSFPPFFITLGLILRYINVKSNCNNNSI